MHGPGAELAGLDFSEFGAEQHDLSGKVNPQVKNDCRSGGGVYRDGTALAKIDIETVVSQDEKNPISPEKMIGRPKSV